MGTQGLVSVVKDNEVQLKIIVGTDGYNAAPLAKWLRANPDAQPREIYDRALDIGFGSKHSLVVQFGPNESIADEGIGDLSPLYIEKFSDPKFNPRWRYGTADHVVIVDANMPAPKSRKPGRNR